MTVRPKYRYWVPLANTDEAQLVREVNEMADAGAGGIELVPFPDPDRTPDPARGFGTPAWTQRLQTILRTATARGMTVDQNLGVIYPASAPDLTDINDPAVAQQLVYATATVNSGDTFSGPLPAVTSPDGAQTHLVSVVAARCVTLACSALSGPKMIDRSSIVDLTAQVRDGALSWTAPVGGGTWTLFNFQHTAVGLKVNEQDSYVVDHLSSAGASAVTSFYDKHIMTPETKALIDQMPGPASFFEDSLELGETQKWTAEFATTFSARRGYPIASALPAMTGIGNTGAHAPAYDFSDGSGERVRRDYQQTASELYLSKYMTTLQTWANSHNMLLRVQPYGTPIQTGVAAMEVDIPEGESINFGSPNPLGAQQNYRVVAGGAHVAGKSRVSVECCGIFFGAYRSFAGGRDINQGGLTSGITQGNGNFDSINKAYAGGATSLIWHGFPTLRAERGLTNSNGEGGTWPGYNPWVILSAIDVSENFGPRLPQWDEYKAYNSMLSRTQLVLRQGRPSVDLSVYFQDLGLTGQSVTPAESPAHQFPTSGPLTRAGYTFEYHPQQAYARADAFGSGRLFPQGGAEKALVLNQQTTMPLAAAQRLLELARQGLKVVVVGAAPSRTPGSESAATDQALRTAIAALLEQPSVRRAADEAGAVTALGALGVQPSVRSSAASTTPMEVVRRDAGNTQYYWLYNPTGEVMTTDVALEGNGRPYLLDTWQGKVEPVAQWQASSGRVSVPVEVPAFSAVVYALANSNNSPFSGPPGAHPVSSTGTPVYRADGTLAVRADKAGPVVTRFSNGATVTTDIDSVATPRKLTNWSLTPTVWTPEPGTDYTQTAKTTLPTIPVVALPDGSLPPWTLLPGLTTASGTGTYTTTVDLGQSWTGGHGAVLDLGSAVDTVSVSVNGQQLPLINPSHLVVPARFLRSGVNTITVRVATTLYNAVQQFSTVPAQIYQTPQQYGLLGPVRLLPYGEAPLAIPR